MSISEQKRLFEIMKRYERKLTPEEKKDYQMLVKRHKDDEDLDRLSMGRLKAMYEKYHVNREKPNYDHLFKKKDNN